MHSVKLVYLKIDWADQNPFFVTIDCSSEWLNCNSFSTVRNISHYTVTLCHSHLFQTCCVPLHPLSQLPKSLSLYVIGSKPFSCAVKSNFWVIRISLNGQVTKSFWPSQNIPQQVLSIIEACPREPFWDFIHWYGHVYSIVTFYRADNAAEFPDLTPEQAIVLDTPLMKLVIILKIYIIFLVNQQPQLGQIVILKY